MKKKIMIAGGLVLLTCTILCFGYSNSNVKTSAHKPENIQQLLDNFKPGDEVVAYADSLLN